MEINYSKSCRLFRIVILIVFPFWGLTSKQSFSQCFTATTSIQSNITCYGECNGAVSVTTQGGSGSFSYSWTSGGATSSTLSNLCVGSYSVYVTDIINTTCVTTLSVTLTEPADISVVTSATASLCTSPGSITTNVSGGTPSYSYSWSNGATSSDINNLQPGIYSITITDANGCTKSSNDFVLGTLLPIVTGTIGNATCSQANGYILTSVSGGTPAYTYSWSNGSTNSFLNNLIPGSHTVTVTDASGCFSSAFYTISGTTKPDVSATETPSTCSVGGSINAVATGGSPGYSYLWSTGATTTTISNAIPASYTITVTDANGCTNKTVSTVTGVATGTIVVLTKTSFTCDKSNGSITASVTSGTPVYTYSWSNGLTTQSISGLSGGTYEVTVTDVNGCTAGSVSTVSGTSNPTLVLTSTDEYCALSDGSVSASAGGGLSPYTYSWSNSEISQTISNLTAATYTLTLTDANGCQQVKTSIVGSISAMPIASVSVISNVSCNGGNDGIALANVSGGGYSPFSYSWSSGANTKTANSLSAATYTVTCSDSKGCTSISTAVITEPSALLLLSSKTNLACGGSSTGSATATVGGGTAPFTYSWSNGNVGSGINGLTAGNYAVTVTDANGCTAGSSVNITEPNPLVLAKSVVTPLCGSGNGSVDIYVSGGSSPYDCLWSTGASTSTITAISAGSYSASVTDASGCTAVLVIILQTSPPPTIVTSVTPATCGFNNGAIASTASGGTSPYIYSWSDGATTSSVSGLQAATYTLTVTEANGCLGITTATVDCVTGIKESENTLSLNISPNPSNGNFILDCKFEKSDRAIISLNTILGETVMLIDDVRPDRIYKKQVDTGHISGGIYFLIVQQDHQRLVRKVIVR